jgi:hypothetical protein
LQRKNLAQGIFLGKIMPPQALDDDDDDDDNVN